MDIQLKNLFIISPISTENSPTRIRSDLVKNRLITPVAEKLGYKCYRADTMHEPGKIDEQVIREVIRADLVVADITDDNPNVFYELAVRHATQKPVILIMKQGQKVPFDITTHRTIFYDDQDVETFLKAQDDLEKQIELVLNDEYVPDSPIRQALLNENSTPSGDQFHEIIQILRKNADDLVMISDRLYELENDYKNIKELQSRAYDRSRVYRYPMDADRANDGLNPFNKHIITDILSVKPNLTKEAIFRLIEIEREKAAGLLTWEAAAYLVKSNLGIE